MTEIGLFAIGGFHFHSWLWMSPSIWLACEASRHYQVGDLIHGFVKTPAILADVIFQNAWPTSRGADLRSASGGNLRFPALILQSSHSERPEVAPAPGSRDCLMHGRVLALMPVRMGQVIFVTGTDTNVGKTLLTALLLRHIRSSGRHALAMKPFCSGGRSDARILRAAQDNELPLDTVNPYPFREPVAPLVAARRQGIHVPMRDVLKRIEQLQRRCEILLVEGAGGLFVPLGESFTVADLITALRCRVIVVAANRLGVINHVLLTVRALPKASRRKATIVLMQSPQKNLATRTNAELIAEFSGGREVFELPFLGKTPMISGQMKKNEKKLRNLLQRIFR